MESVRAKSQEPVGRFAQRRHLPTTGSTNDDVLASLAEATGPVEGIVVTADHQDAGRGRLGRTWQAPPGASILASFGWSTMLPPTERSAASTAVMLGALAAITETLGPLPAVLGAKWPNDLVAVGVAPSGGDAKLAGVLAETRELPGAGPVVVVGIGINVNWGELPAELAATGTSLDLLTGSRLDRAALTAALIEQLGPWVDLLEAEGPAALRDAYTKVCVTLGRRVRVQLADGELIGTASTLDERGALIVEPDDGEPRVVTVGDVVHLRAGPLEG